MFITFTFNYDAFSHFSMVSTLLTFYGIYLIFSGLVSYMLIGQKAKTAVLSGGGTGMFMLLLNYLSIRFGNHPFAFLALFVTFSLFLLFGWRASKTFTSLLNLVVVKDSQFYKKGIAFLIIALMAVVSIFIFVLLLVGIFHFS